MNVAAIIPVGPGHKHYAEAAVRSVQAAWAAGRGPFSRLDIVTVPDPEGALGRSAARNCGMWMAREAAWYFLLDADDEMAVRAFQLVDETVAATFGSVVAKHWSRWRLPNRWPLTRADLLAGGAAGTLSMGCFVQAGLGVTFDEQLDVGEDFDFYLRLPSWTKRPEPLAYIGYHLPSAHGPRAVPHPQWLDAANAVIARYRYVEETT